MRRSRLGCPGTPGVSPPPKAVVYVVLYLTIIIGYQSKFDPYITSGVSRTPAGSPQPPCG